MDDPWTRISLVIEQKGEARISVGYSLGALASDTERELAISELTDQLRRALFSDDAIQ